MKDHLLATAEMRVVYTRPVGASANDFKTVQSKTLNR
jgi:hypothetical protein